MELLLVLDLIPIATSYLTGTYETGTDSFALVR